MENYKDINSRIVQRTMTFSGATWRLQKLIAMRIEYVNSKIWVVPSSGKEHLKAYREFEYALEKLIEIESTIVAEEGRKLHQSTGKKAKD